MENKSGENSDNLKEFQEKSGGKYPRKTNQGKIQIIPRNFKKNPGKYPRKANQGKIQIISRNFRKNQGENIQGKQIRERFDNFKEF